jgi:hypothetical protein
VLGLEIGSTLALVLVNGTRVGTGTSKDGTRCFIEALRFRCRAVPSVSEGASACAVKEPPGRETVAPTNDAWNAPLKTAVVAHLRDAGGSLKTGQRALAKTLGASTTELHRTLHALAATGVIALNAAPAGTELRLVA